VKRIRLGHKTYTFWSWRLYLSRGEAFGRRKTQLTLPPYKVSDGRKDNLLETP
jgi:hypothetical protein